MTTSPKHLLVVCVGVLFALACGCHHPGVWEVPPPAPSIVSPQRDFTLVWDKVDANGGPLGPYWGLEKIQHEVPPREGPSHPYPCEQDPYSKNCTENKGIVLDPPQFPNAVICKIGNPTAPFDGHADWIVATEHGCVDWEQQSPDGDYNFRLFPADSKKSGLTKTNVADGGFIGLEFDYYETIAKSQLKFWTELRREVQAENDGQSSHAPQIRKLLNRDPAINPRAAAIGLFGLDCEHGCKSEVHPILAFAIETNPDANDNTWVLFVRNWGNGGFCSSYRHLVDFPGQQVSILLFDDGGSEEPTVIGEKTTMLSTPDSPIGFPTVSQWQGRGPVITFTLPPPEKEAYAELEIHLRWKKFNPPSCSAPPAPKAMLPTAAAMDAEAYLREAQRKLPSSKAQLITQAIAPKGFAAGLVTVPVPQDLGVKSFTPPSAKAAAPLRALQPDKPTLARHVRYVKELCAQWENHLPLYNGKDISQRVCDPKQLDKQMRADQR